MLPTNLVVCRNKKTNSRNSTEPKMPMTVKFKNWFAFAPSRAKAGCLWQALTVQGAKFKAREMVVVFPSSNGQDEGEGDVFSFRNPEFPLSVENDLIGAPVLEFEAVWNL